MTVILPPAHPVAALSPPATAPFDRSLLTASQQAALASLIAHFSDPSLTVAVPPSSSSVPEHCKPIAYSEHLTEGEQFWLSEECFLRFLRATKWDEAQARDRLAKTLAWRREFGVESFTREYLSCVNGPFCSAGLARVGDQTGQPALATTAALPTVAQVARAADTRLPSSRTDPSPEAETGKQVLYGYDNDRRPIWCASALASPVAPCRKLTSERPLLRRALATDMRPALQNTAESERQLHQVFYIMTMAENLMPRGVEKLDLFINFGARGKSPSMATSKRVLYMCVPAQPVR